MSEVLCADVKRECADFGKGVKFPTGGLLVPSYWPFVVCNSSCEGLRGSSLHTGVGSDSEGVGGRWVDCRRARDRLGRCRSCFGARPSTMVSVLLLRRLSSRVACPPVVPVLPWRLSSGGTCPSAVASVLLLRYLSFCCDSCTPAETPVLLRWRLSCCGGVCPAAVSVLLLRRLSFCYGAYPSATTPVLLLRCLSSCGTAPP